MRWVLPLAIAALLLAACGGGDDTAGSTVAPTTATTSTTAGPATTAAPDPTAAPSTTGASTTTAATTTTTTDPLVFTIDVAGGEVEGPDRMSVSRGDRIAIVVTADVTDEVHLHGYDFFAEVSPDAPARIEIVTDIPGIFELEMETSHILLSELEVR